MIAHDALSDWTLPVGLRSWDLPLLELYRTPAETLALTHTVRDRATFAHGALAAARFVVGRKGWFTMRDVLGLTG